MFWLILKFIVPGLGALHGAPQALKVWSRRHAYGISTWFIALWALNEFLSLVYVSHNHDIPLVIKYSVSLVLVAVIAYFKIKDKRNNP